MSDLQSANIGLVGAVFAAVASTMTGASDAANCVFESEIPWQKAADDGAAATATNELVLCKVPRRAMLVSATYTPATATGVTADATNYASLILQSRDTNGNALGLGTTNTTPTANGGTGNFLGQWKPQTLTVTAFDPTNTVIPAGGSLTFKIAKAAAGVVVPGGTLTAQIRFV